MRILAFVLLLSLIPLAHCQQAPYVDPGLKTVVQIAIVTKDIEASAKRWAALLGIETPKVTTTRPGTEVKVVYRGKPSNGQAKLAFFRAGQVAVELIEPVGPDTSWKEYLDKHGEGVQHLGFQVQDLDKSIDALTKLGMPAFHRGRYDKDNGDYVYVDSEKALGVVVELLHSDPPKK